MIFPCYFSSSIVSYVDNIFWKPVNEKNEWTVGMDVGELWINTFPVRTWSFTTPQMARSQRESILQFKYALDHRHLINEVEHSVCPSLYKMRPSVHCKNMHPLFHCTFYPQHRCGYPLFVSTRCHTRLSMMNDKTILVGRHISIHFDRIHSLTFSPIHIIKPCTTIAALHITITV